MMRQPANFAFSLINWRAFALDEASLNHELMMHSDHGDEKLRKSGAHEELALRPSRLANVPLTANSQGSGDHQRTGATMILDENLRGYSRPANQKKERPRSVTLRVSGVLLALPRHNERG
jgi:hypothetical protein